MVDALKVAGNELDASYVKMHVKVHEGAVKLFDDYRKHSDDAAQSLSRDRTRSGTKPLNRP